MSAYDTMLHTNISKHYDVILECTPHEINPVSGIRNPGSTDKGFFTVWNSESKAVLDYLTWPDVV